MVNMCQANVYYVLGIANPLYLCYLIWYPQQLSDVGAIIIPFFRRIFEKNSKRIGEYSVFGLNMSV